MKKIVMKLDLHDDRAKHKAMKRVSTLSGIDSMSVNMEDRKLTVIGTVDPLQVVSRLKKYWRKYEITIGEANEPVEENRKVNTKKKEAKQVVNKKAEENKRDTVNKKAEEIKQDTAPEVVISCRGYTNPHITNYYYAQPMEENPNSCVIC